MMLKAMLWPHHQTEPIQVESFRSGGAMILILMSWQEGTRISRSVDVVKVNSQWREFLRIISR